MVLVLTGVLVTGLAALMLNLTGVIDSFKDLFPNHQTK